MLLEKMELHGFKRFGDREVVEFDPGINVVKGGNEKGKSTLLEGFIASIFDLTKPEREKSYSWLKPEVCRVTLTYSLDNGDRYKIERDFINNSAVLFEEEEEGFVPLERRKSRIKEIVADHFGLDSATLFENTIVVKQNQLTTLEEKKAQDEIHDSISTLLAGATKQTVSEAIESLMEKRKPLKPLKGMTWKGKPARIHQVEDELKQKRKELNEAEGSLRKLRKNQREYRGKSERLQKLEQEWSKKKAMYDRHQEKKGIEEDLKQIDSKTEILKKTSPTEERKDFLLYVGIGVTILSLLLSVLNTWAAVAGIVVGLSMIWMYFRWGRGLSSEFQETMEGLTREKATLGIQLKEYGDVEMTGVEAMEIKQRLDELDEIIPELRGDINRLEGGIEEMKRHKLNPVEVKEKIDRLEREKKRIQTKIQALDLAKKYLQEAEEQVHSEISPTLSKFVEGSIKKITHGRYQKAVVTPDLDIKVKIPETEKMESIRVIDLSKGTKEQIYLTIRIAISDILSDHRKLPMFFDEAFVNFDPKRFSQAMELLKKLSKRNQMIFLTIREYYDEYADNVIRLEK